MVGYCEYHDEEMSLNKFEWKGCWSCHYFKPDKDFPFVDVDTAAEILQVSRSTIIRWIKSEKIVGYLFERGRKLLSISPPHKKYFIESKSIEELKNSGGILTIDYEIIPKEFEGLCPICNHLIERHYEYQTEKMGLESGVCPLQHITYECEKCRTVIKKDVNGFFVYGDFIDFDESSVTIKTYPSPPPPYPSGLGFAETTDTITVQHKLDLSDLKWFNDNLEWAEILVIDNVAVKLSG